MKKITLFAVAVIAISFASCKKDRTCTCTVTPVSSTDNGVTQPIGSSYTQVMKITKVTKKGAACNSGEQTETFTSGSHTYVDVIKADCKLS
jgi:hypothetical protein